MSDKETKPKKTRLQMLEDRRAKDTLAIRVERSKENKRKRKERETALFTIGGAFAALLEDPETREAALKIWNGYLGHQAPKLFTDNRRAALKAQFNLEPRSRPPSAE